MHGVCGLYDSGEIFTHITKLEHWFDEALLVMGQGEMTTHWEVTWTEDVDEIDYFVRCTLILG
jgi:hypothetical protein